MIREGKMNYKKLRPQSLRLKPVNTGDGSLSLSSHSKQRRSFSDRLLSRETPETAKQQGLSESLKIFKQPSFPGILRHQDKPTKTNTPVESLGQDGSNTITTHLSEKPVPTRKVAFKEDIESAPSSSWRPLLHRSLAIELDPWEISDDDDDIDDKNEDDNNDDDDDGYFFRRNEDPQKIRRLKDCYRDAPRSLVMDGSILSDKGYTYLPSFHSYREALTQHLFSSDEEDDDEEEEEVFGIEEDQYAHPVCHHPECVQNATNGKSLLLCKECDSNIHRQPGFSGHLVLDLPLSVRNDFGKKIHSKTEVEAVTEEEVAPEYNIQEEILKVDHVDGLKLSNSYRSIRNSGVEKRLRRKDAVKRKTSCASTKDRARSKSLSAMEIQSDVALLEPSRFQCVERTIPEAGLRHLSLPGTPGNGFLQVFLESAEESVKIPALKGKSIQELLSPQLEHHHIDISSVNIYLESSNTPLPMNSDAGYLEGTSLFIKAKDGSPEISPTSVTAKEKDKRIPPIVNLKTRRASNLPVDDSSVTLKGARPLFITNKQKVSKRYFSREIPCFRVFLSGASRMPQPQGQIQVCACQGGGTH